jgi:8-oxo-dGTP pyrophosphatase MutT (NUDIX family)
MAAFRYDVDPVPSRAPLEVLLHAHRPHDAQEQQHRARMMELLRVPGDPFVRSHLDPGHFTASAFVLSADRSALLLIHHAKLGCWVQPGGHIESSDDDVLEAARREVLEEVGLAGLPLAAPGVFDLDVHRIPARPDEAAHEHFDVRFLFHAAEADPRLGGEARLTRWVPLHEIAQGDFDRSVTRAVEKLIG